MPEAHMNRHTSCGAIIYRHAEGGALEVLVMHHEKTDTWRLPKGTVEPGESKRRTAMRETREETGLFIRTGLYIGSLPSTYARGREVVVKTTHYFLAQEVGGSLDDREEQFDLIEYIPVNHAIARLRNAQIFEPEWLIVEVALAYLTQVAQPAES